MDSKTIRNIVFTSLGGIIAFVGSVFSYTLFSDNTPTSSTSSEWMKNIDDNKYLSELSIPGSHDSGALYSIADLSGKCQDLSIGKQLESGIRFLDMRLTYRNGGFFITHGIVDQRQQFFNTMEIITSFLTDHPSETILMSIKNESGDNKDLFKSTLEANIKDNTKYWYTANEVPMLGSVRGKIILISRYDDPTLGIDLSNGWKDNTTFDIDIGTTSFHIQDQYELDNASTKIDAVKSTLEYSESHSSEETFNINYLSGVLDNGFPPSYSVPIAKELNPYFLANTSEYHHVGTMMFDFVSEELASNVYKRNF